MNCWQAIPPERGGGKHRRCHLEYDLVHRFLSVSERWHVVSGYSREELATMLTSWLGMVHPEDRPRISATFAELTKLQGDLF